MKALIYARCSTLEQSTEGVSLDVQIARCQAYAAMQGLEVVDVIQDAGVSGSKALASRQGGKQLLQLLRDGQAQHVIILRLDRGFRSASDALSTVENWDKHGIALHMCDMGGMALSTSGSLSRFLLTMLAGCAELERNLIAERTKAALAVKREQGVKLGRPTLDRTEQPAAVRARELSAQGCSLRTIAAVLSTEGLTTSKGALNWSPCQVSRLLEKAA